eukprot:gene1268-4476_t
MPYPLGPEAIIDPVNEIKHIPGQSTRLSLVRHPSISKFTTHLKATLYHQGKLKNRFASGVIVVHFS